MPVRVQHEISPPPPNGKINQPGKCKISKVSARLQGKFLTQKNFENVPEIFKTFCINYNF